MIRVVIFLAFIGALAFAEVWLADRPGNVVITWEWLGEPRHLSVMTLVNTVIAFAIAVAILWSIWKAIWRSPDTLWRFLRARRGVRGYLAVSQGLIAVGSGDARAARRLADEARRVAPDEPLTLLLTAQASQLAGDRAAAERTFQTMAAREDTKLLGLHGLFIEAQRRNDPAAARLYAEEAARQPQVPTWAGHAVFDACCRAGDWAGALDRLERNAKSGLIDRVAYRRQRAVLLTAQALAAEERDRDTAKALALEAVKLAPTLVPSAALAGRMLGEAGELRKAARIVEAAWRANPHPDLADTHAHLQPGSSARDRLARVQGLAASTPGQIEGALAVARAALDAHEFVIARQALAPLLSSPTQRVAMLMAELEEREHGDEGRAREWMTRAVHARRDPAWTADGFVSRRWLPVSPVTGRLDAFQWKDPLAGTPGTAIAADGRDRAIIEPPPRASSVPVAPVAAPPPPPEPKPFENKPVEPRPFESKPFEHKTFEHKSVEVMPPSTFTAAPSATSTLPEVSSPRIGRKDFGSAPPPPVERVIPLVHVPDDPGPEPEEPPAAEAAADKPGGDGWLRGLFK
jgi:HemY protein